LFGVELTLAFILTSIAWLIVNKSYFQQQKRDKYLNLQRESGWFCFSFILSKKNREKKQQ